MQGKREPDVKARVGNRAHLDGLAALEAGGLTAELSLRGKGKMDDGVFHQSTRSSRVNPGWVGTVGAISATVPRG